MPPIPPPQPQRPAGLAVALGFVVFVTGLALGLWATAVLVGWGDAVSPRDCLVLATAWCLFRAADATLWRRPDR